jgi:flagellar biosynthetic protein FliO
MIQSPDVYSVAFKMFGALGLVLLILFGFFFGLRRFVQRDVFRIKGNLIQLIATHYLGGKKNISIFKVPGTYLVVGVTNDQINLLARLKEKDWPQTPSLERNFKGEASFLTTLLKVSSKNKKTGADHG